MRDFLILDDVITLDISAEEIKGCIKKTLIQSFNERDNLRDRSANVRFDSLLRGYIGEYAIKKWFKTFNIVFESENSKQDHSSLDIDLIYKSMSDRSISIEVKTSLVPDKLNDKKQITRKDKIKQRISNCIETLDIKLLKRGHTINDLESDIHIQIYFGDVRKAKDKFLDAVVIDININTVIIKESFDLLIDKIYEEILAKSYIDNVFFIGWVDKESLVARNPKVYTIDKRNFYECKLKTDVYSPIKIIDFLKNI